MNGADKDAWLEAQFTSKQQKDQKTQNSRAPQAQPKSLAVDAAFSTTKTKTAVKIPTGKTNAEKALQPSSSQNRSRGQTPDPYGDDFENYDEDFESFEDHHQNIDPPRHVSEVHRALYAENERVSSATATRISESPASPKLTKLSEREHETQNERPKSNHIQVSNSSYISQKIMRRARDLKEMIQLDVAIFDVFEMAPLNEYEQYIRDFGASNTAQVSTQWNEESTTTEVQTDDWCVQDKWTQAPPEELRDAGDGRPPDSMAAEQLTFDRLEKKSIALQQRKMNSATSMDSLGLLRFVRHVGPVVDVLLEENTLGQAGYCEVNETSNIRISHGMLSLNLPSVFGKRSVHHILYSELDYRTLVAVWGLPDEKDSHLDHKGIIAIYRITDSTSPQHILLCDSEITFCTLLPPAPHLVIAGTSDGGISIWDLRDSETPKAFPSLDSLNLVYKLPSYSVDGVFGLSDQAHCSPIVSIFYLPAKSQSDEEESSDFNEVKSFQIASLDSSGRVQFWNIDDISEMESEKYFETDYGLACGSKVRVVRGGGFDLDSSPEELKCIGVKTAVKHPIHTDKFLLGTDTGHLLHESRFRNTCFPQEYTLSNSPLPTPVDSINSIHFNPHSPFVFLASYESGTIALFYNTQSTPLMTWKLADSVAAREVLWSTHRPSVFYVLDSKSVLHVWDTLESETTPTYIINLGVIHGPSGTKRRAVTIAQSPALTSAQGSTAGMGSTASLASSANRNASLTIAYGNGDVDTHFLNEELVEQMVDE
ncbi:hypothetical protein HDU98_008454, partial [Podochytrium sp. JEL0797]